MGAGRTVLMLLASLCCLQLVLGKSHRYTVEELRMYASDMLDEETLASISSSRARRGFSGTPFYFNQTLDHFTAAPSGGPSRFMQKYYMDDTYWDEGSGPVLLYINGEAPCEGIPSNWIQEYAQSLNALMLVLEHRFYGESQPFDSLSNEHLPYLSSKQAIEDVATFISWYNVQMEIQYPETRTKPLKWITIGCSYAGALSAWFRLKHPEHTRGSLSSSGVVNAILDFTEFDTRVATAAGPACADRLRAITHAVEDAMASDRAGTLAKFQASYFEDDGDFYYMIADAGAETVQYGFQNLMCDLLEEVGDDPEKLMDAYAQFLVEWWYPDFNGGPPVGYTSKFLQREFPTNTGRAWWWQTCSELAYFQNAPEVGSIRSHNVNMSYHHELCMKVFNNSIQFPPNVAATNAYYGGADIKGTRIFFINSSQDPWQEASVVSSPSPAEATDMVVCGDCGHCSDLRGCPSLESKHNNTGCLDMRPVNAARDRVLFNMELWLAAP